MRGMTKPQVGTGWAGRAPDHPLLQLSLCRITSSVRVPDSAPNFSIFEDK